MKKKDFDDLDIVAGGVGLSEDLVRSDITEPKDLTISSEVDRRIVRLLMLHKKLRIKFRNHDLSTLTSRTKRTLLNDMYDVLGITRLADDK
jgi:hypothetical protein